MAMKIDYSFIRTVFALVVGLVLVCAPQDSTKYIMLTLGVLFVVPGAFVLISYFASRHHTVTSPETGEVIVSNKRFPIEGLGSLLLGIWFIADPLFFANLVMIVLSIILIIGGLQQLTMLYLARKYSKVHIGFYIVPFLILLAGVFTLLYPSMVGQAILIVIGAVCLVYALSELLNWFMFLRHKPLVTKEPSAEEIKD